MYKIIFWRNYNYNNDLGGVSFGVDESGNYGYIKDGADTVTPFNNIEASTQLLYESLKYSGLVTEDMTFDEICNILSETYPEIYKLYMSSSNEGEFSAYASGMAVYDYTCFAPDVTFEEKIMNIGGWQKYQGAYGHGSVMTKLIDLSGYSKIIFDYDYILGSTSNTDVGFFITPIKQALLSDVAVLIEVLSTDKTVSSKIGGHAEFDISSLNGNFYIGFSLYYTVTAHLYISNMYMI